MRKRVDIENQFRGEYWRLDHMSASKMQDLSMLGDDLRLLLEVMLDIRDLLKGGENELRG